MEASGGEAAGCLVAVPASRVREPAVSPKCPPNRQQIDIFADAEAIGVGWTDSHAQMRLFRRGFRLFHTIHWVGNTFQKY